MNSNAPFHVRVNDRPAPVRETRVAAFAIVTFDGPATVEVQVDHPVAAAVIRPLSRGITATVEGPCVRFHLAQAMNLSLEIEGHLPLYFFSSPGETNPPLPTDANVLFFRAGQVHEAGELQLQDNQTLYIEEGAVLRGCVRASNAKNIRICGRGILDGDCYQPNENSRKSIVLDRCEQVRIEDITMIHPSRWMLVLGRCRDVQVRNIKQIGEVMCSDGIDICGSKDVQVDGCFLCNNDDCVAIKAVHYDAEWCADVENVLVQNCIMMNEGYGNTMEIGYESHTDNIRNITFRNCDVLHVHGHGAVFSIHVGDHATVQDVLYEDIRVEHYYTKLVDFRVAPCRGIRDQERGQIRNICLKNIRVQRNQFNAGSSISIIGGYDAQHTVQGVSFEDFYLDNELVLNADQLDLFTKQTSGIVFSSRTPGA
jgi:polygalacturonase